MRELGTILRRLVPLLVGLCLAVALHAWAVEPYWVEVTRHRVEAPLDRPLTIAHVTDLHTSGPGRLERKVLAILEEEQPDVILVTGDTIPEGEVSHDVAAEVLGRMHAPLGVWTIWGNWDYAGGSATRAPYERLGVHTLSDEARPLRVGGVEGGAHAGHA